MKLFESMDEATIDAWLRHDDEGFERSLHRTEAGVLLNVVEKENEAHYGADGAGLLSLPDYDRTTEDIHARLERIEPVVRGLLDDERHGIDRDFGVCGQIRSNRGIGAEGKDRVLPWMERLRRPPKPKVELAPLIPPRLSYVERERLKRLGYDGAAEDGDVGDGTVDAGDEVAASTPAGEDDAEYQARLVSFLEEMQDATPEELAELTDYADVGGNEPAEVVKDARDDLRAYAAKHWGMDFDEVVKRMKAEHGMEDTSDGEEEGTEQEQA
jgi:hypothetical protein